MAANTDQRAVFLFAMNTLVAGRAVTVIAVDVVNARASVLTSHRATIIDIDLAARAVETALARAYEAFANARAFAVVQAWIRIARIDQRRTVLTFVAVRAFALVTDDPVHAARAVLTGIGAAID
jgi:hypothetical protein